MGWATQGNAKHVLQCKNIDVRHNHMKDRTNNENINIFQVLREQITADFLTKLIGPKIFNSTVKDTGMFKTNTTILRLVSIDYKNGIQKSGKGKMGGVE